MTTDTDTKENVAQTVERITNGRDPVHEIEDINVAVIPEGFQAVDLERYMGRPRRHSVQRDMATLEGFAEYVAAHTIKDRTAIYVDHNAALAVLNDIDRTKGDPVWGGHKAMLKLGYTPEWKAWREKSGQFQPQREFVDFIQDRAGEITQPALADLVQQLRGINAETTGSRRDASGHLSSEMARQMQTRITNELPEHLELSMAILTCEPDQRTTTQARLYAKLTDDGVTFAVVLVNPESVIDQRIREFVDRLRKKVGKQAPVYF